LVHASARTAVGARSTSIVSRTELVDHHSLENVALVIDVVEDVSPEGVELLRWDEETTSAHPQTVCKGSGGKSNDEDRYKRSDEYDERLGGDQIEEEPHDPSEESLSGRSEVAEPVGNDGEEDGDDEEVWDTSDEVGNDEGSWAVETVSTLLHVEGAIFKESGDIGDSHERHESSSEELQ